MDEQLLSLLDVEGVLSVVATTPDGLVVAAAGLRGDDAEIIGAAGSMLVGGTESGNGPGGSVEVGSASVHLLRTGELSLVVLTESVIDHASLLPHMEESLVGVSGVLA